MILPLPIYLSLAATCAPHVAPDVLQAIIQVESGFDTLAIGVNGKPRLEVRARSPQDAAIQARALIKQGRSVDMGLGQINSGNLDRLGLTVEQVFEPCLNLTAAGRILADGYAWARQRRSDDQAGLRAALSIYNTGSPTRGLHNGYVAKVLRAAQQPVDAPQAPRQEPASWDVFGRGQPAGVFLITLSAPQPAVAAETP
ncbi:lytic transglycosylase domain-containing protein [Phenylobacterium sp.]|uniref:lytic transglycosylase domain-containing protein n=1 Tax=Phenylobacterium sp. TaxID=1871053 RepID=UPI002732B42E|nr:lytic transglycosylase domain-containing protein [Phenylobacterium sp.]MDP3635137.1 lytic transglycosylase domain-containing protein [Phenylobacterium sp.]